MEIKRGMVVRSLSGHDAGSFYIVVAAADGFAEIADGKLRTVEKPKRKNVKHLAGTKVIFPPERFATNKQTRHILWPYNHGGEMPAT